MGDPVQNPPPGFDALSLEEKVDYVESLWGYVLDHSPAPLPEWQREIIEERLAAHRSHPEEGRPWEDVRAELERKHLTVR